MNEALAKAIVHVAQDLAPGAKTIFYRRAGNYVLQRLLDGSLQATPQAPASGLSSRSSHWGPLMWKRLHLFALSSRGDEDEEYRFFFEFSIGVPSCCASHWQEVVGMIRPRFGRDFFAWTVEAHNEINRLLGKPNVSQADALSFWQQSATHPLGATAFPSPRG